LLFLLNRADKISFELLEQSNYYTTERFSMPSEKLRPPNPPTLGE
jgi:hypothetical protein